MVASLSLGYSLVNRPFLALVDEAMVDAISSTFFPFGKRDEESECSLSHATLTPSQELRYQILHDRSETDVR